MKKSADRKENRPMTAKITILIIVLLAVAAGVVFLKGGRALTVADDIDTKDITEFYYTTAASTNPAVRKQYHFYMEGEQWWFFHESREGNHWPLTEKDIVSCGTVALSAEDSAQFISCISGGKVTKRTDSAESGSKGPWLYLYWKGDKGKYQQFSFADYSAQTAFEQLCAALENKG